MKILALSGSLREQSTNTALLRAMAVIAPAEVKIDIFDEIGDLPIFNPDKEGRLTSHVVSKYIEMVNEADGLIISSPEYAHGIPGGLKNALDWLVSNENFPGKPVMIAHASHRGKFVLEALQEVLRTMSAVIVEDAFLQIPLMSKSEQEITETLNFPENRKVIEEKLCVFIKDFN